MARGSARGDGMSETRTPTVYGELIWWEQPIQLCLGDFVRDGDTVFDIGANVGGLSVALSRMVGSKGRVVAFEANPFLLPRLHEDLRANGARNVQVVPRAVWSRAEQVLSFYCEESAHAAGSSLLVHDANAREVKVETTTIDAWCAAERVRPTVLKIDVEGAEHQVLQGAQALLRRAPPVIVLEYRPQHDVRADVLELLTHFDYTFFDTNTLERVDRVHYLRGDVKPRLANVLAVPAATLRRSRWRDIELVKRAELALDGARTTTEPLTLGQPGRYLAVFELEGPDHQTACLSLRLAKQHELQGAGVRDAGESAAWWQAKVPEVGCYEARMDELRSASCSSIPFEVPGPSVLRATLTAVGTEAEPCRIRGARLFRVTTRGRAS